MGEIRIRARRSSDLDGCVSALAEVFREGTYPTRWPLHPTRFLAPPNTLQAWVAVNEDNQQTDAGARVVGQVIVRATDDAGIVEVGRLFVTPAARGARVGFLLLQAARDWATAQRLALTLEVDDAGAAAIALYERTGWSRVRTDQADWTGRHGEAVTLHHYELHAE